MQFFAQDAEEIVVLWMQQADAASRARDYHAITGRQGSTRAAIAAHGGTASTFADG
jgi:hypothetical protein